ncbi:MAG: hypothetical protein KDD22_00105, partial [Bdellovibrionales bacterium]|nr:hypothetical protein [Bdellovibrionales bacterium]
SVSLTHLTMRAKRFGQPQRGAKPSMKAALRSSQNSRGQIVVEYVLLLIIAVSVAFLMTSQMVSRSEESPGFVISKWKGLIDAIGADPADDLNPPAP